MLDSSYNGNKWNNEQQLILFCEDKALKLHLFSFFLSFFLSEVETRQENIRKKPENKNQQKQSRAENKQ